MNGAAYSIISADSHVVEPGDLWLKHIDRRYAERAPRLVREETTDVFWCEGLPMIPVPATSAAGRDSNELRRNGRFEEDVFPGAYDPDARLKDMAADGVDAEVIYPTFAMRMYQIPDPDFKWAVFAAYNDWATEFCGAYPDRLKGVGMVFTEDVPRAVAELERIRKRGLVGAMTSIAPADRSDSGDPYRGQADYGQTDYDQFWAAAQDLGLPVSLHVVTEPKPLALKTMADHVLYTHSIQRSLASMVFGGLFARFPKLRVISAENDAGWVPYMLERMDYVFDRRRNSLDFAIRGGDTLPSEYFRRHVALTFMRDATAVANRAAIGLDNLLWSSDYPHNDSTWPHSRRVIAEMCAGVPEPEVRRIVRDNAAALYGFAGGETVEGLGYPR
jgi:predicted TIM-barrel fold metal-dependent hydrolase